MRRNRVLVVEDDLDAAEVMCLVIESLGHECRVAHCGRDAMQVVRELQPQIVMIDLGLPDQSGFELARSLRDGPNGASLHLVAVTGYGDASRPERARAAGFDDYVVKPVLIATIAQAIARADKEAAGPSHGSRSTRAPGD